MRVLLDENIDQRLKRAFDSDFAVMTGDYPCGSLTRRRSRPRYTALQSDFLADLSEQAGLVNHGWKVYKPFS